MLPRELNYEGIVDVFWTDSKVVLGYINNEAERFHIFVANRVQQIREYMSPSQWQYMESKANPADDASRGLSAQDLISDPGWLSGPDFLWKAEIGLTQVEVPRLEAGKVRSLAIQATAVELRTIPQRLEYFSDWH